MYCILCNHSWCWACGYPNDNWFHTITGDGLACGIINGLVFGFELEIHWFFRLLLFILGIALFPVVSYLTVIGMIILSIYPCFHGGYNNERILICIPICGIHNCFTLIFIWIPLYIIEFAIILTLGILLGSILFVLLLVLVVFIILLLLIRLPYWWCVKNKKSG